MFEADPSIYNNVGKFPSVADFQAQQQGIATNRLHQLILQHAIDQQPVADQLQQLQLQTGQIGNQKANMLLQLLGKISGNGQQAAQPAASAPVATSYPVGNTPSAGAQAMPAPVNSAPSSGDPAGLGIGFHDMAALKALGGPDMSADFKLGLEGAFHPSGGFVTDVNGHTKYVPKVPDGQIVDPVTGATSNAPGYVAAASETARATAAATEAGKNSQTLAPLDRIDPSTGRPYAATVGQLVQGVSPAPTTPAGPASTPTALDQLSPSQQTVAMADMVSHGQDPATMKVNGAPAFGGMQAQLDAAKQGGPEAMTRFFNTMAPNLNGKQKAGLMFDLHTPPGTPIHALDGSTGNTAAPTGAPTFAGPAELAASKVTAENAAKLASQPAITSADALVRNDQDTFKAYNEQLNKGVSEGSLMQQRNAEIRANLAQFQSGLAGGHIRSDIASNLSNMFPDSPAIQEAANKLVGGGPGAIAAAQTFDNLIAGAAVTNANQVLDGNGHINRGIVTMLQKSAESSKSDPAALSRIMDIQDNLVDQQMAEQKALAAARQAAAESGKPFNVAGWESQWAGQRRSMMSDPNSVFYPVSARGATKLQPGSPNPYPPSGGSKTIDFGSLK